MIDARAEIEGDGTEVDYGKLVVEFDPLDDGFEMYPTGNGNRVTFSLNVYNHEAANIRDAATQIAALESL